MKFVEIVDSDDSDAEVNPFGDGSQALQPEIYGGGIAERAKDRSRKAKMGVASAVSATTVEDLNDFADEPGTSSSSAQKRKKRSTRIVDSDEEDDLSRAFDPPEPPEIVEPETAGKPRKKESKSRTKQDKRKALAAYEAPISQISTTKRPRRGTGNQKTVYAENCDLLGNLLPATHVDPTPDLPSPLHPNTSPDFCVNIQKNPPGGTVKDSEPGIGSSSLMTQNNLLSPELVKPPSNSALSAVSANDMIPVIEEDLDELAAASDVKTVVDSQAHVAATISASVKKPCNVSKTGADSDHKEVKMPLKKKRGRPKKVNAMVSNTETSEVKPSIGTSSEMGTLQQDDHCEKASEALDTTNTLQEGEHNTNVKSEWEVPETPALLDSKALIAQVIEKENADAVKQLPAVKREPGKVVNYAASGKNPLLTPRLSSGPRYRVGLSKKIRVDSLHQNINRK